MSPTPPPRWFHELTHQQLRDLDAAGWTAARLSTYYRVDHARAAAALRDAGVVVMPGRRRYSLDMPEVIRLYEEEGWSALRIAEKFGVSSRMIGRRLREAGITTGGRGDQRAGRRDRLTPQQQRAAVQAATVHRYTVNHLTVAQIARIDSVTPDVVAARLQAAGIDPTQPPPPHDEQDGPSTSTLIARHFWAGNMSIRALAARYNLTQTQVAARLREAGFDVADPKNTLDPVEIAKLYIERRMTQTEIARRKSVQAAEVRAALVELGVPLR